MIRLRNHTKREHGVCGSRAEDRTHSSQSYQTWWFVNINETCSSGRGGSWCPMMAVLGMHQTWSRSTVGWRDTSICAVKTVVLIGVPSFQPYPVPPPPTPSTGGGAAKSPLLCILGAHFKLCHHTHKSKQAPRKCHVPHNFFHIRLPNSQTDEPFPPWSKRNYFHQIGIMQCRQILMYTNKTWPWSEHQRLH